MKEYKKKKSRKEQVGFYTSLSICIIAIGMAAYSTFTNLNGYFENDLEKVPVNQVVTDITEVETTEATETVKETVYETEYTVPESSEYTQILEDETGESMPALQTMLTVNTSLSYPLDNALVMQEYSEDSVYNKTLNQWNAHTGVDFKCKSGDNVYSMGEGEVVKAYYDDMYGNTVVVESATYTAYYCGLGDNFSVNKGDKIKTGEVLGKADIVPCESLDDSHIHIEIKVDGNYVDPLTLINKNE